jgi:thiamine biosynthesis lipoprotein
MNRTATLALIALIATLLGCNRTPTPDKQEAIWTTMGTFASLTFPQGVTNDFDDAIAHCRNAYATINNTLSVYSPDTELSRLNNTPPHTPISLSPLAEAAIADALDMATRTQGRFDPTITPLVNLWGFNGHAIPTNIPPTNTIQTTLATIGYTNALIHPDHTFTWLRKNMSLDLGGIAKGTAVDLCYQRLLTNHVTAAVINLGGNIRFLGTHPAGRPWRAGVRDPFNGDAMIGQVELPPGMALATSGNYERFVTINNQRYAHIIDPTTGFPVQGMAGVTVIAPDATTADGLSTALFVAGIEHAAQLLTHFPQCEALLIPDTLPITLYATPKLTKRLHLTTPTKIHEL